MDAPIPQELLNFIDILSPNESELRRLTGMPTDSFEQVTEAVAKCHAMVSFGTHENSLLLKLSCCTQYKSSVDLLYGNQILLIILIYVNYSHLLLS